MKKLDIQFRGGDEGRKKRAHSWLQVLSLACCGLFLASCGQNTPKEEQGAAKNEAVIRQYVDAMNRGDESFLDQYMGNSYIYHGPDGDLDKEGFKKFHHMVLGAFSNYTMRIEDEFGKEDEVVTRWEFSGTHTGDFQGVEPTGNRIKFNGMIISKFENDRVVEEWEVVDRLGMMKQLGMLPPPEGTSE